MDHSRKLFIGKALAIASLCPMLIWAYSSGPDPRKTGAPGDATCVAAGCHLGTPLNGGGGKIELSFSTTNYTPGGSPVTVTLKITDSAAKVYGFQTSSRPSSDTTKGQAGSFKPGTGQFVICESGNDRPASGVCPASAPLEFIEHTQPFKTNVISFQWAPPATSVGDVIFYAASNAANGNGAETGDHIYTTSATLSPAAVTTGPKPKISAGGLVDNWTYSTGIASNTWMVLFGSDFVPSGSALKTWDGDPAFGQGKLPTSLSGVTVSVDGKSAPIYYVLPGQMAFLAPTDPAVGDVPVVVTNANGASNTLTIAKSAVFPAFYASQADGNGNFPTTAVVPNVFPAVYVGKASVDGKSSRPARPGEILSLYGGGFGPTNPAVTTDTATFSPAPLVTQAVIRLGDTIVEQVTSGYLIGPGLYQFNIKVPDNTPNGDIPLTAQINSVTSSSKVYLTVQR